jgi:hypothetical protein
MIWFFGRGNETTQVETRYDNATREYVLEISKGGGAATIERFEDLAAFESRVRAVEEHLRGEAWVQIGGPDIVPGGWRGPLSH